MKTLAGTYIVGIEHSSNTCFISTSVTSIARSLGVHRNTISKNLGDNRFYSCNTYTIYINVVLSKVRRNGLFSFPEFKLNKSDDKPIKELTYEPLFH